MTSTLLSGSALRDVLKNVPTPVSFISVNADEPQGMVVGSFVSISLDPPLVGVFIQKSSRSWPAIEKALLLGSEMGVSLLGAEHATSIRQLSGPADQRFSSTIEWRDNDRGAIHLQGADVSLTTSLCELQDIGDHYFVVLNVLDAATDPEQSSALIFHRSTISSL